MLLQVGKGCVDGRDGGKQTILPSSHTGGRRYFMKNFQDGLAVCRAHGTPDLVSTFMCNPKLPEIIDALLLEPGQQPCDRDDIIVRVHGLKLSKYIDDVRVGRIFGPIKAVVYSVEFQKRGLQYAHILIWQDVDKDRQSVVDKESMSTPPERYEQIFVVREASSLEGGHNGMAKKDKA